MRHISVNKTFVLGLDGATFDVLDPMIRQGHMPNLESLMSDCARLPLDSTMPPVTGPAWLSLATGRSPGLTGKYDFLYRDPDSDGFDFKYMGGSEFRGQSVWDHLGDAGIECGLVDYPLANPAYGINGFMISGGLGSRDHTVTPSSLEEDLRSFEKPKEHLNLRDDKYEDLSLLYDDLIENVDRRVAILTHTLKERDWEFCWAVLQEIDWLQHILWKCFDESHSEASTVTDAERELFVKFWRHIDDVLGDLLDIVGDDTNVVIQSDHGFGPLKDKVFRLNTWLKQEGYLVPKTFSGAHWTVKKKFRRTLGTLARTIKLREWAPELFQWGKNKTSSMAIQLNSVNLDETKIFEPGHIGSMGGLYVNQPGLNGQSVDDFLSEVTDKLRGFSDENDLGLKIFRPEELYGRKAPGSPDLIVRMEGGIIEDGGWNEPLIDTLPDRLNQQNGTHNQAGVLIASGPDFNSGTYEGASCWDLPPTILHLFGIPIPSTMDGTVLTEILSTERDITTVDSDTQYREQYDEKEQEAMEEQLSNLGYFE